MNLPTLCIAPKCPTPREPGSLFCRAHESAPATQRGGWISAEHRRRVRAASMTSTDLDASNIARRLWVGARPPVDRHLPEFDTLVLCAEEIQPAVLAFRGNVLRCPIPDADLTTDQVHTALAVGRQVAEALARKERVLVTCAMGLNRSALVACLGLGLVTYLSASQLLLLVRTKRNPECLSNPVFRKILYRFIGDGRTRKSPRLPPAPGMPPRAR